MTTDTNTTTNQIQTKLQTMTADTSTTTDQIQTKLQTSASSTVQNMKYQKKKKNCMEHSLSHLTKHITYHTKNNYI